MHEANLMVLGVLHDHARLRHADLLDAEDLLVRLDSDMVQLVDLHLFLRLVLQVVD